MLVYTPIDKSSWVTTLGPPLLYGPAALLDREIPTKDFYSPIADEDTHKVVRLARRISG